MASKGSSWTATILGYLAGMLLALTQSWYADNVAEQQCSCLMFGDDGII